MFCIVGVLNYVLVIYNIDGLGGGQNFFRGRFKGVGDFLIFSNQSSCIVGGGGIIVQVQFKEGCILKGWGQGNQILIGVNLSELRDFFLWKGGGGDVVVIDVWV